MTEDYNCKVCGKHFSEEDDYKNHGEDDHPEVNEAYPEIFNKKEEESPAEEIDQQEDKPVQSHDDWVKELEGLQDEFSEEGGTGSGPQSGSALLPEQSAMKNINPEYDPFKATPKSELLQTDPYVTRTTEEAPKEDELIWNGEHYVKAKEQEDDEEDEKEKKLPWIVDDQEGDNTAEEEGDSSGADDPLAKVADLAESYRYMSKDSRASLFESLKFTQGDSAILAGLEWNELTRPVKVEASEAYIKGQEEPEEEAEETEEDEEDKAYESLYNLEKYHSSPDYKKKAITCNRCNEAFYNTNDRNIHYNDVHATEQDYKLPETCPYCNIEIHEPDNLDWHMQEEHGAHVPSQYTQTGLQGAMADTDFDSLESHKKANEDYVPAPYDQHFNWVASMDQDDYVCKHCGQQMMNRDGTNALHSAPESEIIDVVRQHLSTHGITESYAKEVEHNKCPYCNFETSWKDKDLWQESDAIREMSSHIKDKHEEASEARLDSEGYPICQICGETIKGDEDILFDLTNNVTQHLLNHGKSESEVAEIQHKMLMGGAMESRSASDLREEIKKQENFINLASFENPMNMGDAQNKLDGLRSELESLGGEELEATEVECPSCGEEFDDEEELESHQYTNYHGKYEDDYDQEDGGMPRNEIGGQ